MTGRSSCPECGTILRIRDRSFVGRRVSCPECKTTLKIESTNDKSHFVVKRFDPTEPAPGKTQQSNSRPVPVSKEAPATSLWTSIVRVFNSPLTVAWLLAAAVMFLVGILMLAPKFRYAKTPPSSIRTEPKDPEPAAPVVEPPPIVMEAQTQAPEVVEAVPQDVDQTPAISALEPANVDGPLPLPSPMPVAIEEPFPPPPVMVKPPPKIDIPKKLAQPITKYSQPKIRRRDLLEALREQLDAPIRYDPQDLGEESLDETISFELSDTTMGDVIKAVTGPAHWTMTIEETGIRLERKRDAVGP